MTTFRSNSIAKRAYDTICEMPGINIVELAAILGISTQQASRAANCLYSDSMIKRSATRDVKGYKLYPLKDEKPAVTAPTPAPTPEPTPAPIVPTTPAPKSADITVFTARQLMQELKRRGYYGVLKYTKSIDLSRDF